MRIATICLFLSSFASSASTEMSFWSRIWFEHQNCKKKRTEKISFDNNAN
jgi:hypothetical protein